MTPSLIRRDGMIGRDGIIGLDDQTGWDDQSQGDDCAVWITGWSGCLDVRG